MPDYLATVMVRVKGQDAEGNPRSVEDARKLVGESLRVSLHGIENGCDFDGWDGHDAVARIEAVPSLEEKGLAMVREARGR